MILDNDGDIAVVGIALAEGETGGFANVTVFGFAQQASGTGAAIGFANSGTIEIDVVASGVGGVSATGFIFASGLIQAAQGSDVAIDFLNEGDFALTARAKPARPRSRRRRLLAGPARSRASARGAGLVAGQRRDHRDSGVGRGDWPAYRIRARQRQRLSAAGFRGEIGTTTFTTPDGAVVIDVSSGGAGPVVAAVTNSGSLLVSAGAEASGGDTAVAGAIVDGGTQSGKGASVEIALVNSGTMAAIADVDAEADNFAVANATASAFEQNANATSIIRQFVNYPGATSAVVNAQIPVGPALASIDNGGDITVAAQAFAAAVGNDGTLRRAGGRLCAGQIANAESSEALGRITNSGSLTDRAEAEGEGEELAIAGARKACGGAQGDANGYFTTADASVPATRVDFSRPRVRQGRQRPGRCRRRRPPMAAAGQSPQ